MEPVLADPNTAFFLVVLGAFAIYWELHAPGMVVPGMLGLLLVCAGGYGLYQDSPSWYGLTLLVVAALLLFIELKYYTHLISGIAGTILLAFGAVLLLDGPRRVTPVLAISISVAFGMITMFLGFLGMKATQSAPLSGADGMVGTLGIAHTSIDPVGTVFVHGEYWRAHSGEPIASGKHVRVEAISNLELSVKEIQ